MKNHEQYSPQTRPPEYRRTTFGCSPAAVVWCFPFRALWRADLGANFSSTFQEKQLFISTWAGFRRSKRSNVIFLPFGKNDIWQYCQCWEQQNICTILCGKCLQTSEHEYLFLLKILNKTLFLFSSGCKSLAIFCALTGWSQFWEDFCNRLKVETWLYRATNLS